MKFGIIGPNLGVREDIPYVKLPTLFSKDSNMVTYRNGAIRRLKGRGLEFLDGNGDQVPVTDVEAIIHWHRHIDTDGIEYVFAYTPNHVYLWDDSAKEWDLVFTCSSACLTWSSASYGSKVVSTNNLDLVQAWEESAPGTPFANLGSASGIDIDGSHYLTRAKYVIVYESYLVFADTYEDGVARKYRRRWNTRGDITDFNENGAGDAGYNDLEASLKIRGMGIYSQSGTSILITFTNKTHNAMALVEDEIVFRSDDVLDSIGCLAADSLVNDPQGNLYYLATDYTIRQVFNEKPLSTAIDKTLKGINRSLVGDVRSTYIFSLNQMFFAIPKDSASVGNDKIVRLNFDTMGWEPDVDITVSSFGQYSRQSTLNIDDIDVIIDEYDVIIDSVENAEGWIYTLIGDYDGLAYSIGNSLTDKGNVFSGSFVLSSDLSEGQAISEYKRTNGAWFWFECEAIASYKASVEIRTEAQRDFESAGELNLYGERGLIEQWLPFDFRGKVFNVQISGLNPFAFCGVVFSFSVDGD